MGGGVEVEVTMAQTLMKGKPLLVARVAARADLPELGAPCEGKAILNSHFAL